MKQIDNTLIKKIAKILGEHVTGSELTNIFSRFNWFDHDLLYPNNKLSTKWKRLENSLIHEINNPKSAKPLITILEEILNPVRFANKHEQWNNVLCETNFVLGFYGYKVTDGGKVITIDATKTYSEAVNRSKKLTEKLIALDIHPKVIAFCKPELLAENYYHAIFEASKSLFQKLRDMTNSSYDGNHLINQAFNSKNPSVIIKNNLLKSTNELNEYNGLKSLLNTICYLYRNPIAHIPKIFNPKSEMDAIAALSIISLAYEQIDDCICVRLLDAD